MKYRVPLVDLSAQVAAHAPEWKALLAEVVAEGRFVGGERVQRFEEEFARYVGAKHGIGVGSGADALRLVLIAAGIRNGDRVATVSHTFVSTADAIVHAGGRPRFVDVDPVTFTMDPDDLARKMDASVRAILVVHLYGQVADMDRITEIATKWGVPVIEDAAQSHGATYRGATCGHLGAAGCFSFYPSKNLGAFGDGGFITTDREEIAEPLRLLRDNGAEAKYRHTVVGFNSRLDTLQAAILSAKLPLLDRWNDRRRQVAARYRQGLAGDARFVLPQEANHRRHVYHLYVIRVSEGRDRLRAHLERLGIEAGIHYPLAVHQQPAYRPLLEDGTSVPRTEEIVPDILSLPVYPEITDAQVDEVISGVRGWTGA